MRLSNIEKALLNLAITLLPNQMRFMANLVLQTLFYHAENITRIVEIVKGNLVNHKLSWYSLSFAKECLGGHVFEGKQILVSNFNIMQDEHVECTILLTFNNCLRHQVTSRIFTSIKRIF